MLSWPNELTTFYHYALISKRKYGMSWNIIIRLRNNYTQCPATSKNRGSINGNMWMGTISLSVSQQRHSTKARFSQIITNITTQVSIKEFLKSMEESYYTQELNCTHPAESKHRRQRHLRQATPATRLLREHVLHRVTQKMGIRCAVHRSPSLTPLPVTAPCPRKGGSKPVLVQHCSQIQADYFMWSSTKTQPSIPTPAGNRPLLMAVWLNLTPWAIQETSWATLPKHDSAVNRTKSPRERQVHGRMLPSGLAGWQAEECGKMPIPS